jgi:hypothetical protein
MAEIRDYSMYPVMLGKIRESFLHNVLVSNRRYYAIPAARRAALFNRSKIKFEIAEGLLTFL